MAMYTRSQFMFVVEVLDSNFSHLLWNRIVDYNIAVRLDQYDKDKIGNNIIHLVFDWMVENQEAILNLDQPSGIIRGLDAEKFFDSINVLVEELDN